MKHKNRFTGILLPVKSQKIYKYIFIIIYLCTNSAVQSATLTYPPDTIKALSIGDKVPDVTINNLINYPKTSAKISDFKGKLLILDFWATWCSPCVAMIPKMDTLQNEFSNQVQFISVTKQNRNEVMAFFNTHYPHQTFRVPNVIDDQELGLLFPHKFLPHYVWINKIGIVAAFTSDDYINKARIQSVLDNGYNKSIINKYDVDVNKPLFSDVYLPTENLLSYHIMFKGRIEGTGAGTHFRKSSTSAGISLTNATLLELFNRCGDKLITNYSLKNLKIITRDSSDLFIEKSEIPKKQWYHQNVYSIDCIVPAKDSANLYNLFLNDLNNNTNYNGEIIRKKMMHYEIRSNGMDMLSNHGRNYLNTLNQQGTGQLLNAPMYHFIYWLNRLFPDWPIVTDKTGSDKKINLIFTHQIKSIQDLKSALSTQGFTINTSNAPIEMLIVKEKL